jgi:hypothetical protein
MKKLNATPAILIQDITYTKDDKVIQVLRGTDILIDTENEIALIGIDHVDIASHEYAILETCIH